MQSEAKLQGFAFTPDDENQEAFDQAFPYVETDDQIRLDPRN